MDAFSILDVVMSFILTWAVVLTPPVIVRFVRRSPLSTGAAVALSAAFYFGNVLLFSALGSQSKTHAALVLGAIVSFYIYRWRPKAGLSGSTRPQGSAAVHNPPESTREVVHECPQCGRTMSQHAARVVSSRRAIAREWLVFLGAALVGLIVVPPVVATLDEKPTALFYSDLMNSDEALVLWFVVLVPYLAVQLFRSVLWANRQLRN